MKKNLFQKRKFVMVLLFITLLGGAWIGCSTTEKERREEATKGEEKRVSQYRAKYYHFDDILVPGELDYQQKRSFIYETSKIKTGSLIFTKWWLDVQSLVEFFSHHMEKDHWKLVNSFKGRDTILNFSKPDRVCTIKIIEKWSGMVEVEIRVGPLGEKRM